MYRLIEIQRKLKAPKNQRNNFGGYSYRSCEDILEAVKPLLAEYKLALIISDEVISIDGGFEIEEQNKRIATANRVYIKATAKLFDSETGKEIISTSALAREEETKKGMDYAQLTGATSSYARKYALNGLFAIDDTKDSDATNKHGKEETKKPVKKEYSAVEDIFGKEEINPDTDLIEGLNACADLENLKIYYLQNYKSAKDKEAFEKAKNKKKKALGG